MKILKKRIWALVFDSAIIGTIISSYQLLVPAFEYKIKIEILLLLVLCSLKILVLEMQA